MTDTTAWDRLTAARPRDLSHMEREAMLSRVLSSSPGPAPSERHPRRAGPPNRRQLVLAGVAAVVAVAGVTAGLRATDHGAGAKVQLASYTFRLPSGYRPGPTGTGTCNAANMVQWPAGTFNSPQEMFSQFNGQPHEPGIVSAVSATGGCIAMALVGPYTPGGPLTPTVTGIGGPLSLPGAPAPEQLQVGSYPAQLGSFAPASVPNLGLGAPGSTTTTVPPSTTELVLDVAIPAPGGQIRSLLVSSTDLSRPALVAIVAQGLAG